MTSAAAPEPVDIDLEAEIESVFWAIHPLDLLGDVYDESADPDASFAAFQTLVNPLEGGIA
ncbi:hypothetical protein [Streptomyces tubercidicus]|uniref:hypothetical protein n=1 Tax=Streptomyces tubercidicus TaxID=47759 RepID=UPI0034679E6F